MQRCVQVGKKPSAPITLPPPRPATSLKGITERHHCTVPTLTVLGAGHAVCGCFKVFDKDHSYKQTRRHYVSYPHWGCAGPTLNILFETYL